MNPTDILKTSLNVYEDKLRKLIAKRDSEIEVKVKELKENLTNTLYADEIKELQETIANFYILINKEKVEEVIIEEPVVEEQPAVLIEEKVEEPKVTMKEVKVEDVKKALPIFNILKKKPTNGQQVGRAGIKNIANPKRG